MLFTAVPPSSNPNAKLNIDLHKRLCDSLKVDLIDVEKIGRVRFSPTVDTPSYAEWPKVLTTAKSIRWIVLELNHNDNDDDDHNFQLSPTETETMIADKVYSALLQKHVTKDNILQVFHAFGNNENDGDDNEKTDGRRVPTFNLSCRRWDCSIIPKESLSTTTLSHQLRGVVAHTFDWEPYRRQVHESTRRGGADLEFQFVLSGKGGFLELVLLVPTKFALHQDLPKPGCKRVEAWMLVETCDIQEGQVVLDPLCGKATFLVEAATTTAVMSCGTKTRYIGVDKSADQLRDARENVQETGATRIELNQGDARKLDFLPNDSVDVILTCPPFGKQFGSEIMDLAVFYQECLHEWTRVCKGRFVILIDTENAETMIQAIRDTGVLQLDVHREPFRLGRLSATVLVATRAVSTIKANEPLTILPWEGSRPLTRAGWTRLRAATLPSLVPYSSSL